jgi:hypothetical protein
MAKRKRIGKQDAMHAEGNRGLDVWFQVVDVNSVSGIDSVIVKEHSWKMRGSGLSRRASPESKIP